jgi:hypothetical protein
MERNNISTCLPLSTRTLMTFHLSTCADITIAFVCGKDVRFICFAKGYLNVRPLGVYNGTLNCYMIYLAVVFSLLSLVFEG